MPNSGSSEEGSSPGTSRYLGQRRTQKFPMATGSQSPLLGGVKDPDFLAIGLGGTNMLAMLWTIAMGKRAVGVEIRGDPFLGVHWNIREDLYHQLGLIDQMMLERYGLSRLPRQHDGSLISLSSCFYTPSTRSGDIVPDEIIDGYDKNRHLTGRILNVEYIDDRWKDEVPTAPDPAKIRSDMHDVLDGPSMFQAGALYIQILLRRYLEGLEELDLKAGRPPRVRLFTRHRVIEDGTGFLPHSCGRIQVRIEEITEMDYKGTLTRIRTPGSDFIDIGIPELFSIAHGINCPDAERLGFKQHDIEVDHMDGRGKRIAQADFIAAQMEILVDGRLRRRIASDFDSHGNEYWVRQIAVGHENDPEIAWLIVEVPAFMSFCPIERGLLPSTTCPDSPEYFAAYQVLLHDYYIEQASLILEVPAHDLRRVQMLYGPKPFSLVERMGDDALIAPNGVVAGDSFGNGHFLTSAGAMAGMIGHSYRFLEYWKRREAGKCAPSSIRLLTDRIKSDTEILLEVSAKEFSQAIPINFGVGRGAHVAAASGIDPNKRAVVAEAGTRKKHVQAPLNPSDWRRLFIRNGKIWSRKLPDIGRVHPALRMEVKARL
ncbi:hypothetical protein P154DRAFT_557730 [Amniculicola lignicola CBS 123094]|uniref:FAD/NAD(P)-binding domain-containing protein n=1 Tax=Amniculicola lignicola CBS 123094 TaxID=1392246 RepID=A0A6A5VWT9_9PLEO|nr:hypothetical protein P154DRAFT_557730 [Amniculicola lignicola CBS 123094]